MSKLPDWFELYAMERPSGDHDGSVCRPSSNVTRVKPAGAGSRGAVVGFRHSQYPTVPRTIAPTASAAATSARRFPGAGAGTATGAEPLMDADAESRFRRARSARISRMLW